MIHEFPAYAGIVCDQNAKQTNARWMGHFPCQPGQFFFSTFSDAE
jgi:hypothetical protein